MSDPTSPANSTVRWRVAADAALRIRCWDGEYVVWHGASGDTHRLPEAVGQLLQRLLQAPASGSVLSEQVDLHLDDVQTALTQLRQMGIVESIP